MARIIVAKIQNTHKITIIKHTIVTPCHNTQSIILSSCMLLSMLSAALLHSISNRKAHRMPTAQPTQADHTPIYTDRVHHKKISLLPHTIIIVLYALYILSPCYHRWRYYSSPTIKGHQPIACRMHNRRKPIRYQYNRSSTDILCRRLNIYNLYCRCRWFLLQLYAMLYLTSLILSIYDETNMYVYRPHSICAAATLISFPNTLSLLCS